MALVVSEITMVQGSSEIANDRIANGSTKTLQEEFDDAKEDLTRHFERLGELAFSFDSATTPAVKQMREKLLLAGAGSMNLELDEVGSNMSGNSEVLTSFLELYDVGKIKQKLIKNTTENIRSRELPGITPTNLMMFGTPSKLLDGGATELQRESTVIKLINGKVDVLREGAINSEDLYKMLGNEVKI